MDEPGPGAPGRPGQPPRPLDIHLSHLGAVPPATVHEGCRVDDARHPVERPVEGRFIPEAAADTVHREAGQGRVPHGTLRTHEYPNAQIPAQELPDHVITDQAGRASHKAIAGKLKPLHCNHGTNRLPGCLCRSAGSIDLSHKPGLNSISDGDSGRLWWSPKVGRY